MANKADIVAGVANEFNETKTRSEQIAQFVLDAMYDEAMDDGAATFGAHKMVKKVSAPRRGRNPQTGDSLLIPEKTKIVYKRLNRE